MSRYYNSSDAARGIGAFVCVIGILLFLGWGSVRYYEAVQFYRSCDGYLERAGNANTVELAAAQLKVAVDYIESHGLTSGYTSIFFRTPDEDIDYWHRNLRASLDELQRTSPNASLLERSNILLKLRETLISHGEHGESVIEPRGIEIYPFNTLFLIWGLAGVGMIAFGAILFWLND